MDEADNSPVGKTGLKFFEPEFLGLCAIKNSVMQVAKKDTKVLAVAEISVIANRTDEAIETALLRLRHLDFAAQNADAVAAKAVETIVGEDQKTIEFPTKG